MGNADQNVVDDAPTRDDQVVGLAMTAGQVLSGHSMPIAIDALVLMLVMVSEMLSPSERPQFRDYICQRVMDSFDDTTPSGTSFLN